MGISISEFRQLVMDKYKGNMPIHKFIFHYPTAKMNDLPALCFDAGFIVRKGYVVSKGE